MLWQRMMTECVHMIESDTDDSIGGTVHSWSEGDSFDASIVKDRTVAARVAEKDGVTELYTITTNEPLRFHDVIKRVEDGETFRVTSNDIDSKPPKEASFSFVQVQAERWVLA